MAFSKGDSLRDLLALHEQRQHAAGESASRWADAPSWTPPVDLYETATEYVLTAELPGLSRDQIEIDVEAFRIVIRGARSSSPADTCCEQFHLVERGHGRFARAFTLPDAIDVARVSADLKDGVLTITVPKAADREARQVRVS